MGRGREGEASVPCQAAQRFPLLPVPGAWGCEPDSGDVFQLYVTYKAVERAGLSPDGGDTVATESETLSVRSGMCALTPQPKGLGFLTPLWGRFKEKH